MHTTAAHAAPADTTCPACGEDWYLNDFGTHYLLDVQTDHDRGECYCTFAACCEAMQYEVEACGYQAATGRTVASVVQEITGQEVLEVLGDGDGTVVCRLRTVDPTVVKGERKASSPKGWQAEIFEDVDQHHRHHPAPQGWKFGIAIYNGGVKVGVATVGRPVSRVLQAAHPDMLEVTRICTWGHAALRKNVVSKLYAAAGERAKALGYHRLVTYTIHKVESGASLQASGWVPTNVSSGGSWKCSARPDASEAAPTNAKVRWERGLSKGARRRVRKAMVELPTSKPAPTHHVAQLRALLLTGVRPGDAMAATGATVAQVDAAVAALAALGLL